MLQLWRLGSQSSYYYISAVYRATVYHTQMNYTSTYAVITVLPSRQPKRCSMQDAPCSVMMGLCACQACSTVWAHLGLQPTMDLQAAARSLVPPQPGVALGLDKLRPGPPQGLHALPSHGARHHLHTSIPEIGLALVLSAAFE